MNHVDAIAWPDQTKIISKDRRHATLDYIQNVFYNTGLVVAVIYLALKLFLVPTLDEQYSQRLDLSVWTLLRSRKLVSKLQKSLHTTLISNIGYNERAETAERCTQTSEDGFDVPESCWTAINKRLGDSALFLQEFSNSKSVHQMDTFNVEARVLSNRLKTEIDTDSSNDVGRNIVHNVRQVKGWFVSGRAY